MTKCGHAALVDQGLRLWRMDAFSYELGRIFLPAAEPADW